MKGNDHAFNFTVSVEGLKDIYTVAHTYSTNNSKGQPSSMH